ncbi:MAG: hypothetical protein NTZ39_11755 [Methanoregula sp.]|nr:hypothetical protein [Methanoregula sp.]
MTNMELFLTAAQDQNVLARDDIETWLWELKAANAEGRFTFAGMMFAVAGRK